MEEELSPVKTDDDEEDDDDGVSVTVSSAAELTRSETSGKGTVVDENDIRK